MISPSFLVLWVLTGASCAVLGRIEEVEEVAFYLRRLTTLPSFGRSRGLGFVSGHVGSLPFRRWETETR